MDFNIPEEMKMVQTLARDFVKDQLIPLERELLGRESDLEGARRRLAPEKEAELVKKAKETGLWGLNIPESIGGASLGALFSCLVEEEMAKTVIPFNAGDVTPVLFECNELQKTEYLLPAIEGTRSAYLALIEPGQEQGPSSIKMKAVKADGKYILNGIKLAAAGNGKADFAIVFAVTEEDKGKRESATCFLVDKGAPGFFISADEPETGWKSQVAAPATLRFENCAVTAEKVLGQEGKAFQLGKKWLPLRRIIRSARCIGAAVRLLDASVEHVKSWQSLGQPISQWPHIRKTLAEMATDIQAARLLVYQAACHADEGQDVRVEAAMSKILATEMLERTANRAVLVRGGPGPSQGLPLEILCRSLLNRQITERNLDLQKEIVGNQLLKLGTIL
jgi:acyl-CoA dehydrogenase